MALIRTLKLLEPPPGLSVWAWAELRRVLGKNVTARPGRYYVDSAPYQREPQESFLDREVMVTVLYWAKRLGKTEIINNLHGSIIEQWPMNILHCMPTLDSAKKWSKQFFMPMIRGIAVFRRLIKDPRSRDANNTILSKEFPGGTISAIGANSPSGFRQVQAPVVTCDEIDAMEDGPEGDPVTLAFGRAENYSDSIQVVSSTATRLLVRPKDGELPAGGTGSRIHDWYLKSDQRKWFVPCGCGQWHVLAWRQVKWPEPHIHEEAWYETPCCGAKWSDTERVAAVLAGEWRPTAPFRGIRGYWLNGLNTTFPAKKGYKSKLHQMAAEFWDAHTGGEAALIAWKNTFLCEPHEEPAERIDPDPLLERCEDYTRDKISNEIAFAGCTVDVQGDRLELNVVGLGDADETWALEYRLIYGNPEKQAVWDELGRFLSDSRYIRQDGMALAISGTAIDLGHKPARVRAFIARGGVPRVFGVYGTSGLQVHLIAARKDPRTKAHSYSINTTLAKDIIFARLKLKEAGPRYMHFNKAYDKRYFDGLTAEESRIKYSHGFPQRFYEKVRERNEPLDLWVYWLGLLAIMQPNIAAIRRNLGEVPPDRNNAGQASDPEPDPPKPKFRQPVYRPPRRGFVNGWR